MKIRRIIRISDCSIWVRREDFYWLFGTTAMIITKLIFIVTHLALDCINLGIFCWYAISWYYTLPALLKGSLITGLLWTNYHRLYSMKMKITFSIFMSNVIEWISLIRLGLITTGLLGRNITSIIWIITEKSWDLWRWNY